MEILTKAFLRMEKYKVLELQDFQVEIFMKVNTKMGKSWEKEFINGLMVQSMKVSTKKDCKMD